MLVPLRTVTIEKITRTSVSFFHFVYTKSESEWNIIIRVLFVPDCQSPNHCQIDTHKSKSLHQEKPILRAPSARRSGVNSPPASPMSPAPTPRYDSGAPWHTTGDVNIWRTTRVGIGMEKAKCRTTHKGQRAVVAIQWPHNNDTPFDLSDSIPSIKISLPLPLSPPIALGKA